MATSSFYKQFAVTPNKASEFVSEMTKPVVPTLRSNFHSNSAHLANDDDLKQKILKALSSQ